VGAGCEPIFCFSGEHRAGPDGGGAPLSIAVSATVNRVFTPHNIDMKCVPGE